MSQVNNDCRCESVNWIFISSSGGGWSWWWYECSHSCHRTPIQFNTRQMNSSSSQSPLPRFWLLRHVSSPTLMVISWACQNLRPSSQYVTVLLTPTLSTIIHHQQEEVICLSWHILSDIFFSSRIFFWFAHSCRCLWGTIEIAWCMCFLVTINLSAI